jgi:hypothetical protein
MSPSRLAVFAGAMIGVCSLGPAFAAGVPQKLNDEGRLYDTSTNLPVTGAHTFTFTIYAAGGTSLWSQMSTVTLNDGFFAVTLDGTTVGNTFPAGMFDGSELLLGLKVDSDAEMTPRQPLDSVPYAMLAGGLANRPKCPPEYTQDASITTFVDCKATLAGGQVDEMVRVGDFWIDRYELSTCGSGSTGMPDGEQTTTMACSVPNVTPLGGITWFQANALCANAGKRLCTNAEWQTAVRGTQDPGSSAGAGGACLTNGTTARMTSLGTTCQSDFGAQDMIGNMVEWVGDWNDGGASGTFTAHTFATPWPAGYGDGADRTFNINTSVDTLTGTAATNIPSAVLRGGDYYDLASAGSFTYNEDWAPSGTRPEVGARCCAGGAF